MSKKLFEMFISGNRPITKTFEADSLQSAFERVKRSEIQSDANWDMCPIWEGEKTVTATFRYDRKRYRVVVTNKSFGENKS